MSCVESCMGWQGSSTSLFLANLLCYLVSWILGNAVLWWKHVSVYVENEKWMKMG